MLKLKMKAFCSLALASCMILSLAACGGGEAPSGGGSAGSSSGSSSTQTPSPSTPQTPSKPEAQVIAEQWAEENGFNTTESPEDLYVKAKEEGKVVVYSISSRMKKVKDSFEAKYPDVQAEVFDISNNELIEKLTREFEAGVYNVDVVHLKDESGTLQNELIPHGILINYQPEDIFGKVDAEFKKAGTPLYVELCWWFYNDKVNPDGSPITSWWDLTKPEWKGRIAFVDPQSNQGMMALLTNIVANADMMEADYEKVFGEKLVLSEGCENAGYEWIKRFAENTPIFDTSHGKVVEAVGTPGQTTAPIGYGASTKLRERSEQGWDLQAFPGISPTTGIYGVNTVNIAYNAPHPNAAKLFERWVMGEADGTGEGFTPFNVIGGYPVRSDVAPAEGTPPLSEQKLFPLDYEGVYNNIGTVSDFYMSVLP